MVKKTRTSQSVPCASPVCTGDVIRPGQPFDIQVIMYRGKRETLFFHRGCNPASNHSKD